MADNEDEIFNDLNIGDTLWNTYTALGLEVSTPEQGVNEDTILIIEEELLPLVHISAAAHPGSAQILELYEVPSVPEELVGVAIDAEERVVFQETATPSMRLNTPQASHKLVPFATLINALETRIGKRKQIQDLLNQYKGNRYCWGADFRADYE